MKKILLCLVIAFLFLYSCKKDATKTLDFKYGYFPIDTGHYVIYDVDSITYNDFTTPKITIDTIHFFIKEIIQAIYLDNTGTPTCRIEGYKGPSPNGPWGSQPYYVWHSNRYSTTGQKTEENLTYIKLVFPPVVNNTWAGNSYIDCIDTNAYLANWVYSYQNLDVPYQLTTPYSNLSFDSTLTVVQDSNTNLIADTYAVEKYAKNVGLIYKELDVLALDSSGILPPNIPWPKRANNGFTYTMRAIAYNK